MKSGNRLDILLVQFYNAMEDNRVIRAQLGWWSRSDNEVAKYMNNENALTFIDVMVDKKQEFQMKEQILDEMKDLLIIHDDGHHTNDGAPGS